MNNDVLIGLIGSGTLISGCVLWVLIDQYLENKRRK